MEWHTQSNRAPGCRMSARLFSVYAKKYEGNWNNPKWWVLSGRISFCVFKYFFLVLCRMWYRQLELHKVVFLPPTKKTCSAKMLYVIYLMRQGAGRIPRRIGVSQAYGAGKTICQCDLACSRMLESMCLRVCVCVCVSRGCVGARSCLCVGVRALVKQSVGVLTAMSHAGDQSQGMLQWELLISPLYAWFLSFNLGSCDLRVAQMTFSPCEKTFCGRCTGSFWGREKGFKDHKRRRGATIGSFLIQVSCWHYCSGTKQGKSLVVSYILLLQGSKFISIQGYSY